MDISVCGHLVRLLGHPSIAVRIPALRSVGNIVTGDERQRQEVINCGAIASFHNLLSSPSEDIYKEACWTISNITAGSTAQIQAVLDGGLVPLLVHILRRGEYKAKREAFWAICNATSGGLTRPDQIKFLVSAGCIPPLCDFLNQNDIRITLLILDGLDNILHTGEMEKINTQDGLSPYALMVVESGGLEGFHRLQSQDNADIYQKTCSIMNRYFEEDGDNEDANVTNDAQLLFKPQGGSNF